MCRYDLHSRQDFPDIHANPLKGISRDTRESYPYIPEELVTNILSRLPVQSLARFECVSKQWQDLISYITPVTYIPKLLIISRLKNNYFCRFNSLDNETHLENLSSPIDQRLLNGNTVIRAFCSCNGLFLMQIGCDLFIWNPMREFLRKVLTCPGLDDGTCRNYLLADLCYDYINDEYKVTLVERIRLCYCCGIRQNFYMTACGSRGWKKLAAPFICNTGPFFNGYRHWLCEDRMYYEHGPIYNYVVYFEPSTDEFVGVPMPEPKGDYKDQVFGLGVCDGYFCMTRPDNPYEHSNVEFLAMKEYGSKESWEIMFVISNVDNLYTMVPLFKTKDGEVLIGTNYGSVLIGTNYGSVKAYDVDGNFLRDILVPMSGCSFDVIYYEESWFAPTAYDLELSEDIFCDDLSDSDNEILYSQYIGLLYNESSSDEEEVWPQKKRMEKKFHYIKNTSENSTTKTSGDTQKRRYQRKRKKTNYKPKYGYMSFYL